MNWIQWFQITKRSSSYVAVVISFRFSGRCHSRINLGTAGWEMIQRFLRSIPEEQFICSYEKFCLPKMFKLGPLSLHCLNGEDCTSIISKSHTFSGCRNKSNAYTLTSARLKFEWTRHSQAELRKMIVDDVKPTRTFWISIQACPMQQRYIVNALTQCIYY